MLTPFLILMFLVRLSAQEQTYETPVKNPPVNVEALAGSRGINYQAIAIKKLQSIPRLGFFSVASMAPEWRKGAFNDMMYQGNVTYRIKTGIDLATGVMYVPVSGFRASAGLVYAKGSPAFTLVVAPRIDLSKDAAAESLILAEYKPPLTDRFRLYTRLQCLYTLMVNSGDHARSYLVGRAGLRYQEFSFGLGGNFDWYGENKQFMNNIGGFLNVDLF